LDGRKREGEDAMIESLIDKSAVVSGKVRGEGNVEIAGRVHGEVTFSGEVRVSASGMVGANVSASVIVVEGAVRGNLTATEAISLISGARILGDVRAPKIAIEDGALVRGYVQTAQSGKAPSRPRAAGTAQAFARPAAAPAKREEPRREERVAVKPEPPKPQRLEVKRVEAEKPVTVDRTDRAARKPIPSIRDLVGKAARAAGPPPAVMPVLKKGAKAQKRR
jgi:cytoskeletal protein CcmA (bactofilin family)